MAYDSLFVFAPFCKARTNLTQQMDTRLRFLEARVSKTPESFADVVAEGLSAPQKWLPCRYFYDEAGSHLFEMICDLPEYYLTRTERSILDRHADAMIAAAGGISALVEFGSGSGCKTRILLDAAGRTQPERIAYIPVDISGEFLYHSSHALLRDYPTLHTTAIAAEYNDAISMLPSRSGPRLFLFMGSNVGNFAPCEAAEFLGRIRSGMHAEDRLLVGIDLHKHSAHLEPAYNDVAGVTARFNKNLLKRINRELGADFNLDQFDHHAPFVDHHSRIEMRLVSQGEQSVYVEVLDKKFSFQPGEYIHTENSHKYSHDAFSRLALEAGLKIVNTWTDERDWFAVCLLKPVTKN
jgi:dimethylhistidine N-methyltransferase